MPLAGQTVAEQKDHRAQEQHHRPRPDGQAQGEDFVRGHRARLGLGRKADQVEDHAGQESADARSRLGAEGDRRKEDALLPFAGVDFALVHGIGDHGRDQDVDGHDRGDDQNHVAGNDRHQGRMTVGRHQPQQAQENEQRPAEDGERGQPQGDAPLVEPLGQRTSHYEREHRGQKQPEGQHPDLVRGETPEVGVHVQPHHVVEAAPARGEDCADDQHAVGAVGDRGAQFAGEAAPAEASACGLRFPVGGVEAGDQPVGAERAGQNRRADHGRAHQGEPFVRPGIEAAVVKRRGRREEIEIAQHRRGQAAQPAEQQAVAHQRGPFVVIGRQFGQHRAARHRVERHRHPHADGEGAQPEKEAGLPQRGRMEQQQQADGHRQRRRVHERMSAAPA